MWLLVCHMTSLLIRRKNKEAQSFLWPKGKPKSKKKYLGSDLYVEERDTREEKNKKNSSLGFNSLVCVALSEAQIHLPLHSSVESQLFSPW